MSFYQKLGIGVFLSLNVWLIVIALVKVSLVIRGQVFDLTWALFFQFFEPNVAILVASFPAIRSLFVQQASQSPPPKPPYHKLFRKQEPHEHELNELELPMAPDATLTGMRQDQWRSVSRTGGGMTSNATADGDMGGSSSTRGLTSRENNIAVSHEWTLDSIEVYTVRMRLQMVADLLQTTASYGEMSDRQYV